MDAASQRYFLLPIFAATILMGGVVGYGWAYFSVILEQKGLSGAEIGLAGTVQLTAAIVLTLVCHRFLWKANVFRLQVVAASIGAASFLVLGHVDMPFGAHVALRFFFGCGISGTFMIFEYWLNSLASPQHRGKTLALYCTSVVLGMSSGTVLVPLMIAHPLVANSLPALLFAGVIMLISSIRSLAPLPHEAPPAASPWGIILLSPTPAVVALLFGITESSYWSFMSVFGMREGLTVADATLMLSLISAGGMVMQLPIGWLADRFTPRPVILLTTGIGAVGGFLLIPLVSAGGVPLFIHMFLWGGRHHHHLHHLHHSDRQGASGRHACQCHPLFSDDVWLRQHSWPHPYRQCAG